MAEDEKLDEFEKWRRFEKTRKDGQTTSPPPLHENVGSDLPIQDAHPMPRPTPRWKTTVGAYLAASACCTLVMAVYAVINAGLNLRLRAGARAKEGVIPVVTSIATLRVMLLCVTFAILCATWRFITKKNRAARNGDSGL